MIAYKFITKISKTGTIQLPDNPALFNKEVEVIVLSRELKTINKPSVKEFFDKWGGFLKDANIENSKYEYLMEKYK